MIRTESEKLNVYGDESGEYYNLSADPREFQNLIGDGGGADRVTALRARLDRWQSDTAVEGAKERIVGKTIA